MIKNYIFYAAGSFEDGYGHLYRVLGIFNKYLSQKKSFFLYRNKVQKNFYESNNVNAIKLNDFKLNEDFILIVDTKERDIRYLDNIIKSSSKSICIDSLNKWVKKFDNLIFPNFYFNNKGLPNINSNTKIYHGKKYCIIRKKLPVYEYQHKFLITFGGSDPNNITHKVLSLIYNEVNSKDITVILGKGSLYQENILKKDFPSIKILKDLPSTFEAIENSKIIFTSLGTTVQEIEAAQKKAIICFNYLEDVEDFNNIISTSKNREFWLNGGYHTKLNKKEIKKFIKKFNYNVKNIENYDWGNGWKEILHV